MNIYGYPFAWIYVLHHFEQLGLVTHVFNTSVWEAEAEESWNGDYYWLHRDFQSTMGYTGRPCLKQNKENKNKTFQGIHIGVELWEQWASPYLTFLRNCRIGFHCCHGKPFASYILTNNAQYPCNTHYFWGFKVFHYHFPSGCEVVPHCSLDLHSPNDQWYWASSYMDAGRFYTFFVEIAIQAVCPKLLDYIASVCFCCLLVNL